MAKIKYIDYKSTIWHRIPVQNEQTGKEVLELLKKGHTPSELHALVPDPEKLGGSDVLLDTEEYIVPEENDCHSTIEVYDEDNGLVWDNSKLEGASENYVNED